MAVLIAAAASVGGAVFGQPGSGRAAGDTPVGTGSPTLSGAAHAGQQLATTNRSWNGSPTTFAYAWGHCDASGGSCSAIGGTTAATYTAAAGDVGHTVRATVMATSADGSGAIQVADLQRPARLSIDKTITPSLVTLGTHTIQLHFLVTACGGRPVMGASVLATPIPFNQFAGPEQTTGADGTVTVTEKRERGFPARNRHQHLLAVRAPRDEAGRPRARRRVDQAYGRFPRQPAVANDPAAPCLSSGCRRPQAARESSSSTSAGRRRRGSRCVLRGTRTGSSTQATSGTP
jgi:hypothetical protein